MRILGIDYGEKRIGVAISDESCVIANTLSTVEYHSQSNLLERLEKFIIDYGVKEIVVGLPLNLKGEWTAQTKKVAHFIELLKERFKIPVKTYDERLTSAQGKRALIEADMSRKKRKRYIDKLAAQIMLQDYLERENYISTDDHR